MLKRLSILMLGVGAVVAASAAPLTPNQALSRLSGSSSMKSLKKVAVNPVLRYSFADKEGEAVAYAFEPAQGAGFMILAADDIAYPVLGYSDSGKFDVENMPEQLKDWIAGYGEEIEYAKRMGITPETGNIMLAPRAAREAITPMVKSKWDQEAPYNNTCPTVNGVRCVTGCVATSMAQVMNYFKYPEAGVGTLRVYVNNQTFSMDLASKPFDWANMLDNYVPGQYTDAQATAVANLMKAAGFSVNMGYGVEASGAVSTVIAKALRDNFLYDAGITFEARLSYSASEWDEKVYNNLKSGSPVIYNGNDSEVGHSFICDGYDGKGYYHINWGWSGMSDGYFMLNALNPDALGTGGGEGGGFNFRQGGVFNIRKPGTGGEVTDQVKPTLTVYGLLGVTGVTKDSAGRSVINVGITGGYGNLSGWMNETPDALKVSVGGVFKNAETGAVVSEQYGKLSTMSTINLQPGSYYMSSLNLAVTVPDNLPDGDYKMVAATKNADSAIAPWVAMNVPYSYPDYVLVSKHNGKITATSVNPPQLEISDFEPVGNVYYNRQITSKFKVKNASDYQITDAMSLYLLQDGEIKFKTSSVLVTVDANSEVEQERTMILYAESAQSYINTATEFDAYMVNDFTGEFYNELGKITMLPNPGNPSVVLSKISVDGATTEAGQIGNTKITTYLVDTDNFDITLKFRVTTGYFESKVFADILTIPADATSTTQAVKIEDDVFSQLMTVNAKELATVNIPVSFPEATPGELYAVKVKYYGPRSEATIGTLYFKAAENSAVAEIEADENGEAEYYNMLGVRIAYPQPGELVIERRNGKASKKIFK